MKKVGILIGMLFVSTASANDIVLPGMNISFKETAPKVVERTVPASTAKPVIKDEEAVKSPVSRKVLDDILPSAEISKMEVEVRKKTAQANQSLPITGSSEDINTENLTDIRPQVLDVSNGANSVVIVAMGQLNRIAVPFPMPLVITSADSTSLDIKTDSYTVYVSPKTRDPIVLHIRDDAQNFNKKHEVITLTLIPRYVPARSVHVNLSDYKIAGRQQEGALAWEKSNPYLDMLGNLSLDLALGNIPQGFKEVDPLEADLTGFQVCAIDGLSYHLYQMFEGFNTKVVVLGVENNSRYQIEIQENACYFHGVLAVSAYPNVNLNPGEKTEIFMMMDNAPQKPNAQRSSFLDN